MLNCNTRKDNIAIESSAKRTMASGNWSNMKSEMAGKMMSEVRTCPVRAATAKDAKATNSGTPAHRAPLSTCARFNIHYLYEHEKTYVQHADLAKHLHLALVADIEHATNERRFPGVELDTACVSALSLVPGNRC